MALDGILCAFEILVNGRLEVPGDMMVAMPACMRRTTFVAASIVKFTTLICSAISKTLQAATARISRVYYTAHAAKHQRYDTL
jgi:hypothetical protein